MYQYKKYLVKATDLFEPFRFPLVTDELNALIDEVRNIEAAFRSEIIISYLKDHRISKEWVSANPELVRLITSQSLATGHLENLFDSCRNNHVFERQFVAYINERITENRQSVFY